ncbi:MAG TPA: hypothetical protein VKT21_00380 [Thermoplasmata archaeon]|nr:hypothetical protein [Thermoplasmata archaeon]
MNRTEFVWLLATACVLVFLALEPLLSFAVFGSDTGEYYLLTATLVSTGHFAAQYPVYQGWGSAYPDFPGIFTIAGAVSGAVGADALSSLLYTIPILGALSVLPLFLLFRNLFRHDLVALLGAAFAGVAMPRMFILAHPAPQALGDLFVVAALWMYVEGRRDRRWYLPLALTSGALIVTHHLSSYFFLLAALGAVVLLELWRPGAWSHRFPTRELAFSAGFAVAMLAYWFYYAPRFLTITLAQIALVSAIPPPAFIAAAAGAVVVLGLLLVVRRRRTTTRGGHTRFPSDRSTLTEILLVGAGIAGGLALLLVLPLPPGNQHTTTAELLYFAPYYLPIALAAGTRRLLSLSRLGSFTIAWLGVLALSVGIAFAFPQIGTLLIPSRHVEFLAIPLGLLLALGLGRWIARAQDHAGRPAVIAGGCVAVLLLAANAAIIYPPPSDLGGFQEGLTVQDQALWLWGGIGLLPQTAVASDHPISSMLFGFDGLAATWDTTPALFNGEQWAAAAAELHSSGAPSAPRAIEAVAVDATMHAGVALNPANRTLPLSPPAVQWLGGPPFIPIYESGPEVVYWVDWGT